jgi:hypothetical protein
MIAVSPYIGTSGSERFKNFLTVPFKVDMLYPVFNEKSCDTLFEGWRGKNMNTWYKFTNDDKIVLEFYANYYSIGKEANSFKANEKVSYRLPLPKDINDFINDMSRFQIKLYWTPWIDENFEPKEYLAGEEIKQYFVNLLDKLGKSNELQ